jgi:hypothetical protein
MFCLVTVFLVKETVRLRWQLWDWHKLWGLLQVVGLNCGCRTLVADSPFLSASARLAAGCLMLPGQPLGAQQVQRQLPGALPGSGIAGSYCHQCCLHCRCSGKHASAFACSTASEGSRYTDSSNRCCRLHPNRSDPPVLISDPCCSILLLVLCCCAIRALSRLEHAVATSAAPELIVVACEVKVACHRGLHLFRTYGR